jgi:hypothetical protein
LAPCGAEIAQSRAAWQFVDLYQGYVYKRRRRRLDQPRGSDGAARLSETEFLHGAGLSPGFGGVKAWAVIRLTLVLAIPG